MNYVVTPYLDLESRHLFSRTERGAYQEDSVPLPWGAVDVQAVAHPQGTPYSTSFMRGFKMHGGTAVMRYIFKHHPATGFYHEVVAYDVDRAGPPKPLSLMQQGRQQAISHAVHGRSVVAGDPDGVVSVWEFTPPDPADNPEAPYVLETTLGAIVRVLATNGHLIAALGSDGFLRIWSNHHGNGWSEVESFVVMAEANLIKSLAFVGEPGASDIEAYDTETFLVAHYHPSSRVRVLWRSSVLQPALDESDSDSDDAPPSGPSEIDCAEMCVSEETIAGLNDNRYIRFYNVDAVYYDETDRIAAFSPGPDWGKIDGGPDAELNQIALSGKLIAATDNADNTIKLWKWGIGSQGPKLLFRLDTVEQVVHWAELGLQETDEGATIVTVENSSEAEPPLIQVIKVAPMTTRTLEDRVFARRNVRRNGPWARMLYRTRRVPERSAVEDPRSRRSASLSS